VNLRLYGNWRTILRRAWSLRFMALAAILTGCEAVVMVTGVDWIPLPHGARLGLLFVVIVAAFVSRLVAQKDV
jgi:hypothetical protein